MTEASLLFDSNVERWLRYNESARGRLRHELIWRHLERHLGSIEGTLRVLDVGCGLGNIAALLLGRAGKLVLLDFSLKMLEETRKCLAKLVPAPDPEKVAFVHGNAEESLSRFSKDHFNLILCHNILEYVEAPGQTLSALVSLLIPGGLLSLVVPNCFSDPLKKALVEFDFPGARLALSKRNSTAALFDDAPKHTFSLDELEGLIGDSGLKVLARCGVRIFSDYLPESVLQLPGTFPALLELETEAGSLLPFIYAARYIQMICRKAQEA